MRVLLDRVYAAALALSAAGFAIIAALVLVQIAGRLIDRGARLAGVPPLGLTIPSLAEIGGFMFAGAVFLGLAGTLTAGGHIRVTLLTGALPPRVARPLGAAVATSAAGLAAFATWSSALQLIDSWRFDSVSYGMIPVPLWMPQAVMTAGLALFCVALLDAALTLARGGTPAYEVAEATAGAAGQGGE